MPDGMTDADALNQEPKSNHTSRNLEFYLFHTAGISDKPEAWFAVGWTGTRLTPFSLPASTLLKVLKGSVRLAGATLTAANDASSALRVEFSPTEPRPVVENLTENFNAELYNESVCAQCRGLCGHALKNRDSDSLCSFLSEQTTVVALRLVERPQSVGPSLAMPFQWQKAVSSIETTLDRDGAASVMVVGPVNSGKSTTVKLLLNHFLTRPAPLTEKVCCWLLDVDPGQPLFGIPGTLSLRMVLLPLFSSMVSDQRIRPDLPCGFLRKEIEENLALRDISSLLIKAVHVGGLSPDTCDDIEGASSYYLTAAHDLFSLFLRNVSLIGSSMDEKVNTLLIVNCCGWMSGFGWQYQDALAAIVHCSNLIVMTPGRAWSEHVGAELLTRRSVPFIQHAFQPILASLGVCSDLPYIATGVSNNTLEVTEMTSVTSSLNRVPSVRVDNRALRIAAYLMYPRKKDLRFETADQLRMYFARRAQSFDLRRVRVMTVANDSIQWFPNRDEIDAVAKGEYVAVSWRATEPGAGGKAAKNHKVIEESKPLGYVPSLLFVGICFGLDASREKLMIYVPSVVDVSMLKDTHLIVRVMGPIGFPDSRKLVEMLKLLEPSSKSRTAAGVSAAEGLAAEGLLTSKRVETSRVVAHKTSTMKRALSKSVVLDGVEPLLRSEDSRLRRRIVTFLKRRHLAHRFRTVRKIGKMRGHSKKP